MDVKIGQLIEVMKTRLAHLKEKFWGVYMAQ
jgi:hypothetical protein